MAQLLFDLPDRPLAGLYARMVRRELGLTFRAPGLIARGDSGARSLFARSVAVAMGQSFAKGDFVRKEFARALLQRLSAYEQFARPSVIFPPDEVLDHATTLVAIVADVPHRSDPKRVRIEDNAAVEAAERDYGQLARFAGEAMDWSPEGSLGPAWHGYVPYGWREGAEEPDRWVAPMAKLGEPIWSSQRLPGESVAYLVNFGLERIESNPNLIEPWTETVSRMVTAASMPQAEISEVVMCCKVEA